MYDASSLATISCDASSFGIGVVLLQKDEDGNQRPVAYVSRTLTCAEKNFAQIEKEALAISWARNRLQNFLISLNFTIETDHKPLVPIVTTKFLDDLTPTLLHLQLKLQRFCYTVIHAAGKNLVVADLLSCKPASNATKSDQIIAEELSYAAVKAAEMFPASAPVLQRVQQEQSNDVVGQQLYKYIQNGWPSLRAGTSENVLAYRHQKSSLHIANILILFQDRLWIPTSLRQLILEKLQSLAFWDNQNVHPCTHVCLVAKS